MTTKRSTDSSRFCLFSYSDGRRCRMLRSSQHPSLCHYHARIEQQYLEAQQLGAEISTTLTGHFHTAADINHVLGRVFTALAQGRINRRTAATLIWACQLMLQSLPALKSETKFRYTYDTWSKLVDQARPLSPPPNPFNSAPGSADLRTGQSSDPTPAPSNSAPHNAAAPPIEYGHNARSGRSLDRQRPVASAPASPQPTPPEAQAEQNHVAEGLVEEEPELVSTS